MFYYTWALLGLECTPSVPKSCQGLVEKSSRKVALGALLRGFQRRKPPSPPFIPDMIEQLNIAKVWVDDTHVYAETTDGLRASYAFSDWARLANATDAQRRDFGGSVARNTL